MTKVYKAKRTNHILSVLLAALAVASCTVLCWPHLMSDYNQSVTFSITTSVYYTFVALLLMRSLIKLLLTFRIQGLPGELVAELNKIIVFLIYYSVAFATRAIAVTLAYLHEWPQFNRYWSNGTFNPGAIALWAIQFLVYSVLPIFYLSVVHFINFRTKESEEQVSKLIDA